MQCWWPGMAEMDRFTLVPLHDQKDLFNECVKLLNDQWPRSKAARLRSLEQSFGNDVFPVSLLLLKDAADNNKNGRLIGHSKILPVPYDKEKCFVESVVISKDLRGKGYGRMIMEMTEAYAKRKGVKVVHLTTHDQQGFYGRLGYDLCDPIVVFGGCSSNIQKLLLQNMDSSTTRTRTAEDITLGHNSSESKVCQTKDFVPISDPIQLVSDKVNNMSLSNNTNSNASKASPFQLPPPPPPPPSALPTSSSNGNIGSNRDKVQILHRPDGSSESAATGLKIHMRKVLT